MECICTKEYLQKAALLSEKITVKNSTLPILNAVLISVSLSDKKIIFFSTNLEVGLTISIPAINIKKEGVIAVPARLFAGFVASLPEGENIAINTVNENLVLTTKNTSTTIKCYNSKDFPILPEIKTKKEIRIPICDFLSGLKSVHYAVSLSEMKPEINSVYVSCFKNLPLTFVATDSFRLAEKSIPFKFSQQFSFLIPIRSVNEIIRIFESYDSDITIKTNESSLVVEGGDIKFTSRMIEGSFPEYKQLIPKEFSTVISLNKRHFSNALKTASIFCGKLNEVRLKIYEKEDFIEIQTNNSDTGEHTVSVPAKIDGGDLSSVFNYRYLIECLSVISSDKIVIKFNGKEKPLVISELDNNSFCYLIMPMKDI